jgi:leucyl-tRNA synthetase/predicted alpha/beta hydrolase family esterase
MNYLCAILLNMAKTKANSTNLKVNRYEPSTIEPRWQAKWEKEGVYQPDFDAAKGSTKEDSASRKVRKPFYNLMMFPYPSAEGLHVGSMYAFGGADIYGRFKRMMGYDVFEPMGLDGFGIHSENHAIKTDTHPIEHAKRTEENFYRQLHAIGNSYSWKNKLETYDPDYYQWTQWLFVQLFKSGLAYKKNSPVNFCPSCKTVLSDEQVIDGKCERCGSVVEKRDLEQWFFKITQYAEPLLANIKDLDWTEKVKLAQRNWIGKKEGINITYETSYSDETVTIFTTRPDTNFGATFIALAPEHELINSMLNGKITIDTQIRKKILAYVEKAKNKSEIDRVAEGKEKSGVFTGIYAINPLTNYQMPIWISDFVLGGFGTGALVGVPGHDKRDFEFATKFGLEIIRVVVGKDGDKSAITTLEQVQEDEGTMVNSGFLNGLDIHKATEKIMDYITEKGYGKREITYHLRDWLISRQRYWGPPIPMIYCEACAKKKPKVLVIHGISGDSSDNWFPWFKKLLEEKGYDVLIPDLPNSDHPTLHDWVNALKKVGIKKGDTVSIVAHSLGAPTAIAFIKQTKLSVEKLILVAPTAKEQGEKNWKNLGDAGYPDAKQVIQEFNKANEGVLDIETFVQKLVVYLSDNDPFVPVTVAKSFEGLEPEVKIFKKHGHFNAGAGLLEFPTILDEFAEVEKGNLGWIAVSEEDLPVKLPYIKNFKPLGTGKAPLANHPEFYETVCPHCGGMAVRETDVSDTFLDSSWYFLRYLATDLKNVPFPMSKNMSKKFRKVGKDESEKADRRRVWLPVTSYIGGAEHSVLHLLYSRFIAMALKDMGYVDFEEPFSRFYAHGLIIKDGAKMSKSKGNVINPDDYIHKYGADALRTYLLFLGPFDQGGDFRDSGIDGMSRFLKRVWKLFTLSNADEGSLSTESLYMMHLTIKGITEDFENLRFNTAISKLMIYYNFLAKQPTITRTEIEVYLKLFAPFAPHMTEELWQKVIRNSKSDSLGKKFVSIHTSPWPEFDEKYLKVDTVTLAVQVNGKLRATFSIAVSDKDNKKMLEDMARKDERVAKFIESGVKKVIMVPGKILNFVV